MKHEVDLKNYEVRTDLVLETIETQKQNQGYQVEEKIKKELKVTTVTIEEEGTKKLGKKKGTYITIEFEDVTDHTNKKNLEQVFTEELKSLLQKMQIQKNDMGLIIGLGNEKSTPDSLGPITLSHVLVTNHLFMVGEVEEGFRPTISFLPRVTGETGIETSELIKSVILETKPDFVIVIDALASKSIERLGHTIQITDTGIHPGSGIGNERKEISSEVFQIPVIAIGVPTVVDAVTIVSDTIQYLYKHFSYTKQMMANPVSKLIPSCSVNYLKEDIKEEETHKKEWLGLLGTLKEEEIKQLIFEVLTPIGYNLMVTPKEIDFMIQNLGMILGSGINYALHSKFEES